MKNIINKKNSLAASPKVGNEWKNKSEQQRESEIISFMNVKQINNNFEVFKALEDGQVILKAYESIPAKERGIQLLEIEEKLKESIDNGITVWLEPIGDKSKLRNLRGIKFKNL
jgi:hypothetical protein